MNQDPRLCTFNKKARMADQMQISMMNTIKGRGATRHCCYGLCNSDSRYAHRDYMKDVQWIPFPKPYKNLEKCQRWIRACGRNDFTVERITKWTYICSKHFVGENGPTVDLPDPIPATHTSVQVERFSRKRKALAPMTNPESSKTLFEVAEAMLSLQDSSPEMVVAQTRPDSFTHSAVSNNDANN